jgi:tetratricopeptide (TPR) repeat protein
MSGCSDKHFEKMLYAYELGMLSDEDRREVELHQLECDHCFHRAKEFREAARLLSHDEVIHESIHTMAAEHQNGERTEVPQTSTSAPRRKLWPALLPASLAVAVVLILLLLKPFSIEFKPSQDAIALENRLTVMYFRNLADPVDPQKLGEIISSLLITDLSESHYVRVTSSQRIRDILRLLGEEDAKVFDKEIAHGIARKAGARWVLTGEILQEEPTYVVVSQLVDIPTGDVIASQRVESDTGEAIFPLVDRLTVEVKDDLSLPAKAADEVDRDVADVTTHSSDAYLLYLEGIELSNKYYAAEAAEKFQGAVEIDSSFAMAYYHLAALRDASLIEKAVEYSAGASRKERHYIMSLDASLSGRVNQAIEELKKIVEYYPDEKVAFYQLGVLYGNAGQMESAIDYCERAVSIDPLYKPAHNQLAYAYSATGDVEQAIEAINKYIAIAPDEANPYDSRGDIYATYGRIEEAIESYSQALRVKPDYNVSLRNLGSMYLFIKEYARADSCFQMLTLADNIADRASGRYCRAYAPIYQGKFDEAIRILDEGVEANRRDGAAQPYPCFLYLKAMIFWEIDDTTSALSEIKMAVAGFSLNQTEVVQRRNLYVQLLAEAGHFTRAEEVVRELRADLDKTDYTLMHYWYALGSIELAKGNSDEAVELFEKATEESPALSYPVQYMLAKSYLKAGRFKDAAVGFEKLLAIYSERRHYWTTWTVKLHYLIGIAYEQSDRYDKAIQHYDEFLSFWGNAGQEVEEAEDARARLARLKKLD